MEGGGVKKISCLTPFIQEFDYMGLLILLTLLFGIFCLIYPRVINKKSERENLINTNFLSPLHTKKKQLSDASKIVFIGGVVSMTLSFQYLFQELSFVTISPRNWILQKVYGIGGN